MPSEAHGNGRGRGSHRRLGLALRALAHLLSAAPAAAKRARVRLAHAAVVRDQPLLLLAAAAGVPRAMARWDAARLRLRVEGLALHHPHVEAEEHRGAARERLRLRRAALCAKPGPIRWQFPPLFGFDADRSTPSSRLCRATPTAVHALARCHDGRLAGRAWLEIDRARPLRTPSTSATRASSVRRWSTAVAAASRWSSPTRPGAGRCSRN